jgi:hypothetical protein
MHTSDVHAFVQFCSIAFAARQCPMGASSLPAGAFVDGLISGGTGGGKFGYRIYPHAKKAEVPVVVYFHGNAEVAADYDDSSPLFHASGASLMVAACCRCYLSFGSRLVRLWVEWRPRWLTSSGTAGLPGLLRFLPSPATRKQLPLVCQPRWAQVLDIAQFLCSQRHCDTSSLCYVVAGIGDVPRVLFGRSIGSVCAIHLASKYPTEFKVGSGNSPRRRV